MLILRYTGLGVTPPPTPFTLHRFFILVKDHDIWHECTSRCSSLFETKLILVNSEKRFFFVTKSLFHDQLSWNFPGLFVKMLDILLSNQYYVAPICHCLKYIAVLLLRIVEIYYLFSWEEGHQKADNLFDFLLIFRVWLTIRVFMVTSSQYWTRVRRKIIIAEVDWDLKFHISLRSTVNL